MTKLEFIDKYIELLKQKIESSKESARLYYANRDYEFGKMEEKNRVSYEEELELFKQIKADLEAWEVTKEELQIVFKGKNHYGEPLRRYELNVIGQNKIDTLNKALEV